MTKLTPAKEPVAWVSAVLAALALAVVFLLHPTKAQTEAIVAAAPAVAGLIGRFFVTPNGKPLGDILQLRAGQATAAIAAAQAELDSMAKLAAAFAPAPPPVGAAVADLPPAIPVPPPVAPAAPAA